MEERWFVRAAEGERGGAEEVSAQRGEGGRVYERTVKRIRQKIEPSRREFSIMRSRCSGQRAERERGGGGMESRKRRTRNALCCVKRERDRREALPCGQKLPASHHLDLRAF